MTELEIKLVHPVQNPNWRYLSQLFGVNAKLYKYYFGLPGHNGLDYTWPNSPKNGYGEPVLAAHNGRIVRLYSDHPLQTRGSGIYLLDKSEKFMTIYWHLSEFTCKPNQEVKAGEVIGLAGNTGFVRPKPTKANPYAAVHLHFGLKILDPNYWKNRNNEYNNYVDPVPYLIRPGDKLPVYWPSNLFLGSKGDCVSWLQTALKLEGLAEDYEPIGYFGRKTLRDARKLQKKYGIEPSYGFCGPKTRRILMGRWSMYAQM